MVAMTQYGLGMVLTWLKFRLITDMGNQIMDTTIMKIICPWTTIYTMIENYKLLKIGFYHGKLYAIVYITKYI